MSNIAESMKKAEEEMGGKITFAIYRLPSEKLVVIASMDGSFQDVVIQSVDAIASLASALARTIIPISEGVMGNDPAIAAVSLLELATDRVCQLKLDAERSGIRYSQKSPQGSK